MKKILKIIITITLAIMLVGCSSAKKSAYNKLSHSTSENNSLSNEQSQAKSKDIPINSKDINSNSLENVDIADSQFQKGYYDYEGKINTNVPIKMSIYPLGKDIVGTYYYQKDKTEIRLQGKSDGKSIILDEYDELGKKIGTFQGSMCTIDKIEGTWINSDNKISYPFVLSLESIIFEVEYGKRYSNVVDNKSDQDVENFVNKIQNYIVNDNKIQLAEEIKYPINVKTNGEVTQIKDKDNLIKNYDKIFTLDFKEVISNSPTKNLFVNSQGIMFSDIGNIWINDVENPDGNSKLMIIAINKA